MSRVKQNNRTEATPPAESPVVIAEQVIAERAYARYLARGAQDGYALEDWLTAEEELRQSRPAA